MALLYEKSCYFIREHIGFVRLLNAFHVIGRSDHLNWCYQCDFHAVSLFEIGIKLM